MRDRGVICANLSPIHVILLQKQMNVLT